MIHIPVIISVAWLFLILFLWEFIRYQFLKAYKIQVLELSFFSIKSIRIQTKNTLFKFGFLPLSTYSKPKGFNQVMGMDDDQNANYDINPDLKGIHEVSKSKAAVSISSSLLPPILVFLLSIVFINSSQSISTNISNLFTLLIDLIKFSFFIIDKESLTTTWEAISATSQLVWLIAGILSFLLTVGNILPLPSLTGHQILVFSGIIKPSTEKSLKFSFFFTLALMLISIIALFRVADWMTLVHIMVWCFLIGSAFSGLAFLFLSPFKVKPEPQSDEEDKLHDSAL